MAILERDVGEIQVGDLLNLDLRIPNYQRPYRWEPSTALQLLDDILDAESKGAPYAIGAVILHANEGRLDVVDGQQRLLTLKMLLAILDSNAGDSTKPVADTPTSRVRSALSRRIAHWGEIQRSKMRVFIREQCRFVRVVTDDIDEAFRVFDSQNYRGVPPEPHDLLKAHHLREMRDAPPTLEAAIVDAWEAVESVELADLFSTYLYRIARWSRGESAPDFTVHDIGLFTGLSPTGEHSPVARYHLAAQVTLPALNAWGASAAKEDRNVRRSRFQLDAPLLAGRAFFERVAFLLEELKQLRKEALELKRLSQGLKEKLTEERYRYVSELYVAALLYCTNKFGDEVDDDVRERLFAWAFALRVKLLRVQFRSIDNRGQEPQSAFALLRYASSAGELRRLPLSIEPADREGHEEELVRLLTELTR